MRLDKLLAEMGQGSRSQIRELARKGRIQVNGQTEKAFDRKLDPERDLVTVDGVLIPYARLEYYMLNKPQGVVSATEDGRYPTVISLIGDALRKDLFPVGRLDIDTEGLLLITNDGAMAHSLLSPKKHVDKVYLAHINGRLPEDAIKRFKEGIVLEDGTKTLPAVLRIRSEGGPNAAQTDSFNAAQTDSFNAAQGRGFGASQPADPAAPCDAIIELTIHEGKFHQVKRMFEALGCRVTYLKRLSMGPLTLDKELPVGQYRALTSQELQALRDIQEVKGII